MIDKRLLKEMPKAKVYVYKQVLMQWISLICNIGFVMILSKSIVSVLRKQIYLQELWILVVVSVILLVVRVICVRKASVYAYLASCDVKDHLRKRLYEKVLEMKNSYTSYVSTSELTQLNVEGIDQLETYFGRYLPQFFYSMLAPITLFLILVWMDVRSSLVLLLCVPLIPLSIIAVQKFAKRLLSKYWKSYTTLGDSFLENLQGLTTLKIYQADEYKNKKMNEEAENFRKITMKVLTMQLNSVSVMDIIAYGGAAIGSIVAIQGFMNKEVTLFALLCIILLSSEFFIPLRLLGSFFHIAMNGIAASSKIFRILDIELSNDKSLSFTKEAIDIRLKNVTFSYDDQRQVLKDISLEIKTGQFIGIVGESGSGKSTIAKIISGFTRSYEGDVLLQDKQRRNIKDESFYERFVYVTHKPTMLKGSVRDNLRLGKSDASDDDCWYALEKTQLAGFIKEQGGLDMEIIENGNNLSGGQKQRLSMARALLSDKDIYIFDEATSNIDVESEDAIRKVILEIAKEKSVIMITHRLHNIIESDHIYVISQGECIEQGRHSQLVNKKGVYYDMYTKQTELEQLQGGVSYA